MLRNSRIGVALLQNLIFCRNLLGSFILTKSGVPHICLTTASSWLLVLALFVKATASRLLAFKVATLLILFLTLIRCFSECLTKFGYTSSGGQGLNGITPDAKLANEISLTDQNDSI
ncbi:hypothetical protein SO802_022716 [Lithocarpus litseifolius]|uniref:Uncharacterized protein n=1 Tax=Lithocarpus litseifolius TaxID=425828 RepID=A0AAW2C5N5_9ROSI